MPDSPPAVNYLNESYGVKSWLLTTDHKRIALLYLISVSMMFIIGGLAATLIRLNLLTPSGSLVTADTYNKLFSAHGIIMVFFFLVPVVPSVLGNFCLPLMIGARDLAFPRLNLTSWYIYMTGAALILFVIFSGGIDTGWTFYTPFSSKASHTDVVPALVAIVIAGFSSIFTGLNFIVTVHRLRAPGLTWFRLPLFIWSLYATSIIMLLATPVLAAVLILVGVERIWGIGIFDPALGGDPVLFQHLFWFYSHPAVYIMILPGMGIISEVITCFSRKNIFGYKFVAFASIGIAVVGFLVWAHHMFVAGQSAYAALIFSLLSYLVAVPSAIKVFNWTATLYRGSITFHTPMLFALGFIGLFTHGWADRLDAGRVGIERARSRHLFCHRPFSFHHGRRHGHGLHGGAALLVAENHRSNVFGNVGSAGGDDDFYRLHSDIYSAIRAGLSGHGPPVAHLRSPIPGAQRAFHRRRLDSRRGLCIATDLLDRIVVVRQTGRRKPLVGIGLGMANAFAAANA